jgi:chemotaxis protein methyltransferase WspC
VILHAIELLVRERLGLEPETLGTHALERAIETRMGAKGVSDPAVYASGLMTDAAECTALAAELVVSETWFFRGGRPLFDHLASFVAARAANRPPGNPVRVLSVPCSTGEEPYSLAMALHALLPVPREIVIDGVDLSPRVLARAEAARYGPIAFREGGPDVRPGAFRAANGLWELLPHLRAAVRFEAGNLTDPLFLSDGRVYDLILCRNLFVYLTPEARGRALANIDRLLARDGRLCVTPAEADKLPRGRFKPDGGSEFGVYERAGGSGVVPLRQAAPIESQSHLGTPVPENSPPLAAPKAPPPLQAASQVDQLGVARRLADAGNLHAAKAACREVLGTNPADPDALTLFGVLSLAMGEFLEANDALRKALYLVPDHADALAHMAVLCARRGDSDQAAAFRGRLERLIRSAHPEAS